MKKKQKINKAVNHGEWVLLGLTALFLCFLFAIRDRPAALTAKPPSLLPKPEPVDDADSVPVSVSAPVETDAPPDDAGRLNINTADISALCALPGIGESLAGRIIAYREEHGPFGSPDEIMKVSGIGQGKFDAIKGLITAE